MADDKCILNPEQDCLGIKEAQRVEAKLNATAVRTAETHERIWAELAVLRQVTGEQAAHYAHTVDALKSTTSELEKINARLLNLEGKPGRRWEQIVGKVIDVIVAGLIGYVLVKIGLGV